MFLQKAGYIYQYHPTTVTFALPSASFSILAMKSINLKTFEHLKPNFSQSFLIQTLIDLISIRLVGLYANSNVQEVIRVLMSWHTQKGPVKPVRSL